MIPTQGRLWVVGGFLLTVALAHWMTPIEDFALRSAHVLMRKMFLVPVLLAAAWFGLRGALLTATATTVLYLPHVLYQWKGDAAENLNQIAEVGSLWLAALLAGVLLRSERRKRRQIASIHRATLHEVETTLEALEPSTRLQPSRDELASHFDCRKKAGEGSKDLDQEQGSPSASLDESHDQSADSGVDLTDDAKPTGE